MARKDDNRPAYLLLGEILRPHGVRGELRVRMLTDYPERIAKLGAVYIGESIESPKIRPYTVENMRMNQEYGLLKLEGIDSRNDAELMRELFVMVDIENAVPLEDDEIYLYQLIGLRVTLESGEELGTLVEVIETGANDVYVVKSPKYKEVLVPVTDETILETDPDKGVVVVRLPEGLLPSS